MFRPPRLPYLIRSDSGLDALLRHDTTPGQIPTTAQSGRQRLTGPEVKDDSIFTVFHSFIYSLFHFLRVKKANVKFLRQSFLKNPISVSDSDSYTLMIKSPIVCFHRSSCLFLS